MPEFYRHTLELSVRQDVQLLLAGLRRRRPVCARTWAEGRKRTAEFATFRALSIFAVRMVTLAVIPGNNLRSGFAAAINDIVGDHVLRADRRLANICDLSVECRAWICIYGERSILAHRDVANIRFIHVCVDLHFRQVLRNFEDGRGVQTMRLRSDPHPRDARSPCHPLVL